MTLTIVLNFVINGYLNFTLELTVNGTSRKKLEHAQPKSDWVSRFYVYQTHAK